MCGRQYRTVVQLRRHVRKTHSSRIKRGRVLTHSSARNCLTGINARNHHVRSHNEVSAKSYQCSYCEATFKSLRVKKRHIRVKHLNLDPEQHKCKVCGKVNI